MLFIDLKPVMCLNVRYEQLHILYPVPPPTSKELN